MSERQTDAVDPVGAAETASAESEISAEDSLAPETASLLGLVDRLGALLEKSELSELEVQAGDTGIVLRKPIALAPAAGTGATTGQNPGPAGSPATTPSAATSGSLSSAASDEPAPHVKAVKAPLTGVFYGSPTPTAPAYVTVGQKIEVGQVIGLIEAMKLFNEIKSDQAGRVARVVAETGKLVKARQTLIEVEPA